MKHKLLATLIASTLLSGCNGDNDVQPKSVQAFDGAVWGIEGKYSCDGGISGSAGTTDYDGYVQVKNVTFVYAPESCSFDFVPTPNAIDTSNGKDMSKVSYKAPKGLFSAGEKATVSPITTLITKQLGDEPYTEAAAVEVLEDLGLGEVANQAGVSVTEFLKDTETSLEKIKKEEPKLYSQVAATTVVLSDALVAQPDAEVTEIKDVTVLMTEVVLEQHENYPVSNSGEEVYVDLTEQLEDDKTFDTMKETAVKVKEQKDKGQGVDVNKALNDAGLQEVVDKVEKPEKAEKPERPANPQDKPKPTGGTGGTGGSDSSAGGTGA